MNKKIKCPNCGKEFEVETIRKKDKKQEIMTEIKELQNIIDRENKELEELELQIKEIKEKISNIQEDSDEKMMLENMLCYKMVTIDSINKRIFKLMDFLKKKKKLLEIENKRIAE